MDTVRQSAKAVHTIEEHVKRTEMLPTLGDEEKQQVIDDITIGINGSYLVPKKRRYKESSC
jgi:hypothetical protein